MSAEDFSPTGYNMAQRYWPKIDGLLKPSLARALDNGRAVYGRRVLDVGCGQGIFAQVMLDWGATSVTGFDIKEEMIDECRKKFADEPRARFEHCAMADFKSENKYDAAIAVYVVQFVPSVEELKQSMKAIANAMKDDSVFVAVVPNGVPGYAPTVEAGLQVGASVEKPRCPLRDALPMTVNFYAEKSESAEDASKFVEHMGSATVHFYWRSTYESALLEAGFTSVEWQTPTVAAEALERYGYDVFHNYLTPEPNDAIFVARKNVAKPLQGPLNGA